MCSSDLTVHSMHRQSFTDRTDRRHQRLRRHLATEGSAAFIGGRRSPEKVLVNLFEVEHAYEILDRLVGGSTCKFRHSF